MYDRQQTYLTWGGDIGDSGLDHWQCGLHLALSATTDGPGLPTSDELQTLLVGAIASFHHNADNKVEPFCFLKWARAAQLDPAGHYTAEPVITNLSVPVIGGSTAVGNGAPQVSACVTLWSGATLGDGNYGRFYVPWWSATVLPNGRVSDASALAMATNAGAFIEQVNTWAGTALTAGTRVRIMSRKGAGRTKDVAKIRVGNVKDTQQRRRRQIAEVYSTVAVAS